MSDGFWSFVAAGPTWLDAAALLFRRKPPRALKGPRLVPIQKWRCRRALPQAAAAILYFWQTNFERSGGARSLWTRGGLKALIANPTTRLLVVTDGGTIVGTVLATPLGLFSMAGHSEPGPEVYYIDMLCVAASHRQRSVARALLFGIYEAIGQRPALFLKEGAALSLPPLHSGRFTFRRITADEQAPNCRQASVQELEAWLPAGILYNKPLEPKSIIIMYDEIAAAAFTWTNQSVDQEPLIWMTGFHCKDETRRQDAIQQLSTAGARLMKAPWIWAWDIEGWRTDGPAHLYAFNWNPGQLLRANPFIVF